MLKISNEWDKLTATPVNICRNAPLKNSMLISSRSAAIKPSGGASPGFPTGIPAARPLQNASRIDETWNFQAVQSAELRLATDLAWFRWTIQERQPGHRDTQDRPDERDAGSAPAEAGHATRWQIGRLAVFVDVLFVLVEVCGKGAFLVWKVGRFHRGLLSVTD